MTRSNKLSVLLAGAALLAAAPAEAKLRVVTTTTDLGSIARSIGGDAVQVDTICKGNQDPHSVQARPSYMVTVSRADLLVAVGLELEVGWLPALIQGGRNPKVNPGSAGYFEAGTVIEPIDVPKGPVDRSRGDLHTMGNPHFWLDPENVKRVSAALAEKLASLEPESAETFRKNQQAYAARLDQAIARWTAALAPYRGTPVVSYHATFNYFLRRFGLEPVGFVEERPGIPPAPAHLASLIREVQARKVKVLFHENFYDEGPSQLVAGRTGAKLLVLPISVEGQAGLSDYEKLMDHIVGRVAAALAGT